MTERTWQKDLQKVAQWEKEAVCTPRIDKHAGGSGKSAAAGYFTPPTAAINCNQLALAANASHFPLSRWGNGEHDFDLVAAVTANRCPALVPCTGRDVGLGLSLLRHIASSFRSYFL
jgi:hypothetical protein